MSCIPESGAGLASCGDIGDTTMSDTKTQQLVLSIIEFLNGAIENGTVRQDDREGLEVAGAVRDMIVSFLVADLMSSAMYWRGIWS